MADKLGGKRRKKLVETAVDELSLEDVLTAGGDEEDFEMIKDVDDSSDFVADHDEATSENVEKREIMSYIKQLGFDRITLHDLSDDKEQGESVEEDKTSLGLSKELNASDQCSNSNKGKKRHNRDSSGIERTFTTLKESVTENVQCTEAALDAQKHSGPERKRNPQQKMLIKCGGTWLDQNSEEKSTYPTPSQSDITQLQNEASVLLENEVQAYEKVKAREKSSDSQWLKSVVSSGTLKDKVAALTVQVQDSPVHHLKTLDVLLSMAKKKGRRECLIAVDMLKELWMTLLLPDNRKLRMFIQHPLQCLDDVVQNGLDRDQRDRQLILWYFEEQLKQRYQEFVGVVERLLHDTLVNIRSKSLGIVYDLLSEKPEQEQLLLSLLVNKIGDPDRKVASKAVYLARCLVTKHPNMKTVVTKEMEKLLYRPNVAIKAQYFAVCFLNQLVLTKQDKELATRLVSIYFSFFGTFLKKGDIEAKMLSALLTGVNRAFPYAKEDDETYNQQLDTLFRTVHIGTFNTSVQALMLLFQVMDSRQSVSDRFYQALYAKLLDPNIKASSKQAMFLNVLYKSLKIDPSLCRVKAFVKRILQICSFQQPAFMCGTLFMISELTKMKPGIQSLTQQPEEEDDEEHFVDIPDDDDDDDFGKKIHSSSENLMCRSAEKLPRHVDKSENQQTGPRSHVYKPHQRNPLYSGAENSCLWELNGLKKHYHPSVCHFASTLINSGEIEYNGDPLLDFTLMRFLDRFVYKNPKHKERDHGGSLMQPKKTSSRLAEEPVNCKAFVTKKEENIREDEIFFYRYFKQKAQKESLKEKDGKLDFEGSDQETTSFDNFQDGTSEEYDFASVVKSGKLVSKKSKTRKSEGDEDSEEEQDEDEDDESGDEVMSEKDSNSSSEEFDYDAMEFSSAEEEEEEPGSPKGKKRKPSDKDYEKALLDNLSSDEFSDGENQSSPKKSKKKTEKTDVSSMFASAEQFAHLLENSHASRGGSYEVMRQGASDKQLKWEDKKAQKKWRKGGDWSRGRGAKEGRAPRRRNFNNRKSQKKFSPKGRGFKART